MLLVNRVLAYAFIAIGVALIVETAGRRSSMGTERPDGGRRREGRRS
jgi:hypothetical protein